MADENEKSSVVLQDDAESSSEFVTTDEYVDRMNAASGLALSDYDTSVSVEETDIDHGGGWHWPKISLGLGVGIGAGVFVVGAIIVGAILILK